VNIVEFGLVSNDFDAFLQGQYIVVARHDYYGLGKVHGADSNAALRLLILRVAGGPHGGACPGKLVVRPYKDAELGGGDPVSHGLFDPVGNGYDLSVGIAENLDFREGAIEYGYRAAPVLFSPVTILHDLG
jgi:hypothetical protein